MVENKSVTAKRVYLSPEVEVFQYVVEMGFALSEFETYDGGDPNDPLSFQGPDGDYYMGGPLGEETW